MKILFVNTSDSAGGAAIAARRLQKALIAEGQSVSFVVRDKRLDDSSIIDVSGLGTPLLFAMERAEIVVRNLSRHHMWQLDTARFGIDITKTRAFKEADIIHLHWVNQCMLSLPLIRKIAKSGKPIVWTMHDMWPFTGICHHAENCLLWETHCHDCPKLERPSAHDMSYRTFEKKLKAYVSKNLTFVACSDWLRNLAVRSPLTAQHRVVSIPNAIDTSFFRPGNKREARQALGLPLDKKLLLFVAFKATDKNKGIDYLIESMQIIAQRLPNMASQLGVILTGQHGDTLKHAFPCQCYPQGYIHDPEVMLQLYRAADLLVMPTLMDNLPNAIAEAMSTGLPCVGFKIGGLPQMVKDGKNGFLTQYKNADDFATTVLHTLTSSSYRQYCSNARSMALQMFSEEAVAEKYIELYKEVKEGGVSS